jgi:hypothetical protein
MSSIGVSNADFHIFNVAMESGMDMFLKQSLLMGPASQNTPINPSTSLVTPGEYEGCPVN